MRDDIGVRVVLARTRRDWNQKKLSEKTGLSQKTLSLIEKGHAHRLYADTVVRLAKALGAPAIDLIDGQELASLLKQYELGVKTVMVEKVLVDGEWFGES